MFQRNTVFLEDVCELFGSFLGTVWRRICLQAISFDSYFLLKLMSHFIIIHGFIKLVLSVHKKSYILFILSYTVTSKWNNEQCGIEWSFTLILINLSYILNNKCGTLRDLVPFVQIKKREKHPWRSVNFSKAAGFSLQLY